MLEQIITEPHWFWISFGGLLLAAELLGAGGYSLWSGMSAVLVGLMVWVFPLDVAWQGVAFAILTMLTAYFWWYWLRNRSVIPRQPDNNTLNQRSRQLIGHRAVLSEATHNGLGRVTIADGTWRVKTDIDLPIGAEVEVVAVEGITLLVRPVRGSSI